MSTEATECARKRSGDIAKENQICFMRCLDKLDMTNS